MPKYWAEDEYWTKAADRYCEQREKGVRHLAIDLDAVEDILYDGDGPAYRMLEAMLSVNENESTDGYRGVPRIVLALLQVLSEQGRKTTNN